jgi:hypothetical protein
MSSSSVIEETAGQLWHIMDQCPEKPVAKVSETVI